MNVSILFILLNVPVLAIQMNIFFSHNKVSLRGFPLLFAINFESHFVLAITFPLLVGIYFFNNFIFVTMIDFYFLSDNVLTSSAYFILSISQDTN